LETSNYCDFKLGQEFNQDHKTVLNYTPFRFLINISSALAILS